MSGIVRTKQFDWQYLFAPDSIDVAADKIVESTKAHQELARRDYLEAADRLIVSQELSRDIISGGLSDVSEGLSRISEVFQSGLGHLGDSIYDLKASFDWAAEKVIWHLAEIHKKISQPLDTLGANYRNHGIYAYRQGWFDDAVKDLQKAEEYNRYDFVVHQYLGDALLWKLDNPQKAFDYYQKAARYAEPHSREVASWAKLHAALIKYLQKEFQEAARLADEAVKLCPSAEAHYQHAHYLVMIPGYDITKRIIENLETAIRKDPSYFLKIDAAQKTFEEDFRKIQRPLAGLKKKLFDEVRIEASAKIEECRAWLHKLQNKGASSLTPATEEAHEKSRLSFNKAVEVFNRESYLDFRLTIEFCR